MFRRRQEVDEGCVAACIGYVRSVAVVEGRIYSGSMDKTIRVWDATTHAHLATLEGHTRKSASVDDEGTTDVCTIQEEFERVDWLLGSLKL